MENLGKLVVKAFTRLAGAVQSLEAAVHYYQMMALYFQDVSTPVGMLGKDLIYVSWNNGSMSYNFLKDDCERYSPREVLHKINAFMVTNCQFLDLEAEITKENMIYAEAMKFFVAFETKFGSPKDVTELTNFNSIKLEIITNLCRMRMSTANKNIEQLHKFINKPLKMFESPYDMIKEMKTRLDPVQWQF
uniref:Uncharacterized protein n=1 Tax=Panagrolaimus superbus TaxID=310955 RepID=A0A914Z2A3_9BILA